MAILHSKVQGQKGKVARYVVDSREDRNELESGAVRHVMDMGWKPSGPIWGSPGAELLLSWSVLSWD